MKQFAAGENIVYEETHAGCMMTVDDDKGTYQNGPVDLTVSVNMETGFTLLSLTFKGTTVQCHLCGSKILEVK